MQNYNKSVLSPYDPTKLAIHSILRPEDDPISICGPKVKKTVSLMTLCNSMTRRTLLFL